MSQPAAYAPAHVFVADSATVPNFPGQSLDVEFNAVKATTDQIRANLALIQRDDGAPANGTVTYDTLSPSLQTNGLATAASWLTATSYLVGTTVYQSNSLYRCLVAHTSVTFATDLAAGKWVLLVALPTGPAGPTGPQGIQGVIGNTGNTGATGIGYGGSSTTSLLIANTVTKTFSTQAGLGYQVGTYMRASSFAGGANFMEGYCSSYAGTTLAIDVKVIGGSGTFADWGFAVAGVPGSVGVSSIAANIGAFTLSNGLKNSTNDLQADPVFHRSYLAGLGLSTAGASATFGVAAGLAVDSTNAGFMSLVSAFTKTTSVWALGTAAGSLDTGAIANSTWYHVYLIKRPDTGVVDVAISLSAANPTLVTNIPAAYTLFRRIGSMKTNGSAQWTKFIQDGNLFQWDIPVADVNAANPGTVAVTRTLTVPTGIRVLANVLAGATTTIASDVGAIYLSDLSVSDQAAAFPLATFSLFESATAQTIQSGAPVSVMTNTSAQIRSRMQLSTATSTLGISTVGWVDTRGRDA